jgi:hypothetical protein
MIPVGVSKILKLCVQLCRGILRWERKMPTITHHGKTRLQGNDEGYAKFEGNTRNEWFRFTGYETLIATSIQTSVFSRAARSTHFCATSEN